MKKGIDTFTMNCIMRDLCGMIFSESIAYDKHSDRERFKDMDYDFFFSDYAGKSMEQNCFETVCNTHYIVRKNLKFKDRNY